MLLSIKTGGCPEDCAYCPQSAHYKTDVARDRSRLARRDDRGGGTRAGRRARRASAWARPGATCPRAPAFERVLEMVRVVRGLGMEACCTLGMLTEEQADALAAAGLTAYNHNLDTSPEFYGSIITTRTYDERLATLARVRQAGITVCCGGIIGMGEDRARPLRPAAAAGVARSASGERAGQPAGARRRHAARRPAARGSARAGADDRDGAHPDAGSFVRLSAGRLSLTDEAQALCFLAGANSVFLGDRLLTTPNPGADDDERLLDKLGMRLRAAGEAGHRVRACRRLTRSNVASRATAGRAGGGRAAARAAAAVRHRSLLERLPESLDAPAHRRPRSRGAVAREGCGSTGSRLLRGDRARFDGRRAALRRVQGHRALAVLLERLSRQPRRADDARRAGDVVFSDERNHASLIDGIRLSRGGARRLSAQRSSAVSSAAARRNARGAPGHRFVVVESLFSMDGDSRRSPSTRRSADRRGAVAHRGRGARRRHLRRARQRADRSRRCRAAMSFVSINTAGKALGVSGAFVAGPGWAIEYLVQRARPFVFSTAPPPALADALDASLDVVAAEPERRERLLARVRQYRASRLCAAPVVAVSAEGSQIIPVVDRRQRAARWRSPRALQAEGFDVRAIRPPSVPPGTARLRVSVNAGVVRGRDRALRRVARRRAEGGRTLLRGIFVTGTDTGVGKTVVSAALMHRYRNLSDPVLEAHPDRHRAGRRRRKCSGSPAAVPGASSTTASACRARVSPHLAARLSGRCPSPSTSLIVGRRVDVRRRLDRRGRGRRAGAAERSAADDRPDCAAWLPVLVVSRSGLGTINHTLLTLEASAGAPCRSPAS